MSRLSTDISVILATFNRAHKLRRALTSLVAMNVPPGITCEVIVVDNNSTDDTALIVEPFLTDGAVAVRYVLERRQGKSFALNAGVGDALGGVLAFTDDDCIVDAGWIETILRVLGSDKSLDGVGGRVELFEKRDQPVSIRTAPHAYLFSVPTLFSSIMGCNMALRRRVFDAVGLFDPMFGPGNIAGEDIDLLYRAQRRGLRILYSPEVLVHHNHGRRTVSDVRHIRRQYLGGHGAFYAKHMMRADVFAVRMGLRELSAAFRASVRELWTRRGEQRREFLWLVRGFLYGFAAALGRKESFRR